MLFFFATILQDPTTAVPTGGGGFNWADYGPLGVMAFGLVTAVVILWRKLEREQSKSETNAEKVLTVLISVNAVLPEVLAAIKERAVDPGPALDRMEEQLQSLSKAVKSLARKR